MEADDIAQARYLLGEWAKWLSRGGGYAHQSTLEWIRSGGGASGVFGSRVPLDVEPSAVAWKASQAMQHLRLLDGGSAEQLTRIYLRTATTTLAMLARESGMGLTSFQDRRRLAERQFLGLFRAFPSDPPSSAACRE